MAGLLTAIFLLLIREPLSLSLSLFLSFSISHTHYHYLCLTLDPTISLSLTHTLNHSFSLTLCVFLPDNIKLSFSLFKSRYLFSSYLTLSRFLSMTLSLLTSLMLFLTISHPYTHYLPLYLSYVKLSFHNSLNVRTLVMIFWVA